MRLSVHHETRFRFDAPVKSVIQTLRLSPRNHEGQHVSSWRIDVDVDCRLNATEDAFGNLSHSFDCAGPIESVTVQVAGEVETYDAAGVVRGTVERFPTELFLRDTPMTEANAELREFADAAAAGSSGPLDGLHRLLGAMIDGFGLDEADARALPATKVMAERRGTATELATVFIAAARHQGIPARFVAGYYPVEKDDGPKRDPAWIGHSSHLLPAHAWAEAYLTGIGWIGFDPAKGFCPQDLHLRVAVGLDHLGAAPLRVGWHGAATDRVESSIRVTSLGW